MELGLSTLLFPNESPEDGIRLASQLNLDYVEIILDMPHFSLNLKEERLKELKETIESFDLKARVHGRFWDLNPVSQYPEMREIAKNRAIESIKACNLVGGDVITVHPGRCWFRMNQEMLEQDTRRYQEYVQEVEEVARDLEVILAIESWAHPADLPQGIDEYKQIAESFKNVGITLDIGHAFITASRTQSDNPEREITRLIKELKEGLVNVHLHDNHGLVDKHLPPGRGKINFTPILGALEKHYDGPTILELWDPSQPEKAAIESVKRVRTILSQAQAR